MKNIYFKKIITSAVALLLTMLLLLIGGCKNTSDNISSAAQSITEFNFTVIHKDGSEKTFEISTDKLTVGEALQSQGIISGEEGAFGVYVKTVDGQTLDYNSDGYWWAFYIDGEMAFEGVDKTEIQQGKEYSFRAEKS